MLTVVKVGGRVLEDPEGASTLARHLVSMAGSVVVVHGGGSEITAWQERLGIEVEWKEGLRVTTVEGMRITAMVLSGWMNKRLVSRILDAGGCAVGISGEDGNLMEADRKEGGALGEVGQVRAIDPRPVRALLEAGIIPVVSPVSRGPAGMPLNVNGDEAAIAMAGAMRADRLLLLSDVPGVLVEGIALPEVDGPGAARLLESGTVTGGMQVKVEMALEAARRGVDVRIGDLKLLESAISGTRIGARHDERVPQPVGLAAPSAPHDAQGDGGRVVAGAGAALNGKGGGDE